MPETFRAVAVVRAGEKTDVAPFELAVLPHDERRVRRRMIPLVHGDGVLVDFPEPVTLDNGDCLRLADGRLVEIIAAEEKLYDVRGRDDLHVTRLSWHLGNRHLKAQLERVDGDGPLRILILRDHVIRDMLRKLDAKVTEVSEPFYPEEGAYSHSHGEPAHALLNR
jgi:urease accessory protein